MIKRTAWLAFLLLPACAYQQAMKRGDDALAAQDYDKARRAFAFAYDTKSSDAARDAMQRAQAVAIDGQLDGAEAAVAAGKHVDADRLLREVELLAPENERLQEVRANARAKMMEAVDAKVRSDGDTRETYELVTLGRRLYPDAAEPEYALATLRQRALAEARAQAGARDYAKARETVALIAQMEPWQEAVTSELDRDIAVRWANEVEARAKRARRYQPGLSAVLYARAYEIALRPEDLDASRSAWAAAAEEGPVAVYVDSGTTSRAVSMKRATRTAMDEVPGVSAGRSNSWDLLAKVYANDPSCRESKESETLTKDYISGQREVPNPEYVAVKKDFDAASDKADAASDAVDAVVPREEEAASEARRLDLEVQASKRALEDTSSVLDQTQSQYDRWSSDVEAVKAEIAALAPDARAARADAEERLKMTKGYATEWKSKLDRDLKAVEAAKAALAKVEAQHADASAKAQTLAAERQTAEANLSGARQALAGLQAKLNPLPKTVMEDVPATLEYDNVTWTNTCTAKVTVYLGTKWTPKPESPQRFESVLTTTDTAHIGHEKAAVVKDPKEYPRTSADLIADLAAESDKKVQDVVTGLVDGYFTSALDEAFASSDVDASTDLLTSIYAGAAVRMDTAAREKYAAFLAEHHGLESLETLAPEAPPPPMASGSAEAAEPAEAAASEGEAPAAEEAPAEEPGDPSARPADQPWGDLNAG